MIHIALSRSRQLVIVESKITKLKQVLFFIHVTRSSSKSFDWPIKYLPIALLLSRNMKDVESGNRASLSWITWAKRQEYDNAQEDHRTMIG